jgi:hypothetical protein
VKEASILMHFFVAVIYLSILSNPIITVDSFPWYFKQQEEEEK